MKSTTSMRRVSISTIKRLEIYTKKDDMKKEMIVSYGQGDGKRERM